MNELSASQKWSLRVTGLVRKELMQVRRDPSSYLIAGVLPLLLIFIFGYGVSLDLRRVRVAVVIEQSSPEAESLLVSFRNSPFFEVVAANQRPEMQRQLVSGRLKGVIVVSADFAERLGRGEQSPVQLLVDGSDPNTAGLVLNYAQGVIGNWLEQEALSHSDLLGRIDLAPPVSIESRYWFNPELRSRYFLLPGAIAIVMTLIGTLLTALVVAREWERGTIEALMATPVGRSEFLLGKLIPYFLLGMVAMALAVGAAVFVFGVPFRGSILALLVVSAAYLIAMLSLGLLISTLARNQFAASQAALVASFLPAFELSGFIFEIDSMPWPIREATRFMPPRYFVASLQTLFLAGNVPEVLVPNTILLLAFAAVFLAILIRVTRMRLE